MRPSIPWLAAALTLALAPTPGSAQNDASAPDEPGAAQTDAASGPSGVEAIEIVGERIDVTDVQDEAQAITAFSAEDLDRANIQNIDSLAFNVPGLHVGQSGQQAIVTLRGVGTENASITGEPGVAFHVDGISYSQPSAARVAFFDLESLDVKRGPQGLLGGKNSTSGSINVVTKKPTDEYEVDADVLFGNYDRVRIRGAFNIPLGEYLAVRTSYFHEDRDGFLDDFGVSDSRDPFDADDAGLRTHLRFTPTDSLDVLLSWNWFKQTGNGPQGDLAPIPKEDVDCGVTPPGIVDTVMPIGAACNRLIRIVSERQIIRHPDGTIEIIPEVTVNEAAPAQEDPYLRGVFRDGLSAQDNRFWGWSGTIDWDVPSLPGLGETHIKALGGFQKVDTSFLQDFDATSLGVNNVDSARVTEQYSSELQWSGASFEERLHWQASGFFSRETGLDDTDVPGVPAPAGFRNTSLPPQTFIDQETENKSYGAALHGRLHLSDTVRFELGGRWIKDIKKISLLRQNIGTSDANPFVGCEGRLPQLNTGQRDERVPVPECGLRFRGTSWGSSIDWRPFGGDHLLYAKIDRGYKSGGFRSGQRGTYVPEKIWAYAVGTKSELFDSRLQINLEGFFYAYENMQLVVLDGVALRTENADTRMYGWDLEMTATPLPGLILSGIVSYLNTETLDYFSLDPASTELAVEDVEGATFASVRDFNTVRLRMRDLAEDLNELGVNTDYASQLCFAGPLPQQVRAGRTTRCGLVTPFGGLDDYSGNQLSRAPEWKFTLRAEYEIPLSRFGTLTPLVQYTWQDDTYYRVFNRPFDVQEDHHLTDAKLIWQSPEGMYQAEVFVQNIEDEAPKTNVLVGPRVTGAPPLSWRGPPRFYGVRFGFRY